MSTWMETQASCNAREKDKIFVTAVAQEEEEIEATLNPPETARAYSSSLGNMIG